VQPSSSPPPRPQAPGIEIAPQRRFGGRILLIPSCLLLAGLAVWGGIRVYRSLATSRAPMVPTPRVRPGALTLTARATAQVRGGNSEELAAPMTGEGEMHITFLRKPGEVVNAEDTVLEFDATDQDYKLREAEADLAEAEQQVKKAEAESEAQQEENN